MKNTSITIPQRVTNFPELRQLCLARLYENPLANWSDAETHGLHDLCVREVATLRDAGLLPAGDWEDQTGLRIVFRDVFDTEPEVPKWAALVSWLTADSAAGYQPGFVAEIALLALNGRLGLFRWKEPR